MAEACYYTNWHWEAAHQIHHLNTHELSWLLTWITPLIQGKAFTRPWDPHKDFLLFAAGASSN